jgi:hypothetical protein
VEVELPEGGQFSSEIKVGAATAANSEEQEVILKFVPFLVCLPGDKELVWPLAKRENLTPEEAGIALSKLEEEFWASKTGQNLGTTAFSIAQSRAALSRTSLATGNNYLDISHMAPALPCSRIRMGNDDGVDTLGKDESVDFRFGWHAG